MKVILSRKGFDSKYGGAASPIMPDGTLLSFPIPAKMENVKFSDLTYKGKTYFEIIKELKDSTKIKDFHTCHLDPDIRRDVMTREKGWCPLFGQTDAAQGHLLSKGIQEGDLFLFFGTFRETELVNGKYQFLKNSHERHIIFGYMQVGEIYTKLLNLPKELTYHPHAQNRFKEKRNNCIYKAGETLSLLSGFNGSGCLNFKKELVLTKDGYSKSRWELPDFFKYIAISYHSKNSHKSDYFQSAAIGQEFVIDENELITNWAKKIIFLGTKL